MGMVLIIKCRKDCDYIWASVYVCILYVLDQYKKKIIFKFFQSSINFYVILTLSTILGLAPYFSSNIMISIPSNNLAAKWRGVWPSYIHV